jgi:hypothetical protein
LGRLVLKDVTVLGELAVLDANDVGDDPGGRAAMARERAVGDNIGGNGRRGLHRPRHFPCAVVLRIPCRGDQIQKNKAAPMEAEQVAFAPMEMIRFSG